MQLQYSTLPTSHSRTPSDPIAAGYHTLSHTHKRSPSSDSSSGRSVIPIGKFSKLRRFDHGESNISILVNKLVMTDCKNSDKFASVRRPQNPPPPAPNPSSSRLSNGRSTESISSMASDVDVTGIIHNPIPPPRRVSKTNYVLKLGQYLITNTCKICRKGFDI